MKKIIILSAAALAAICSCTKNETAPASKNVTVISASVEDFSTKAEISDAVEGARQVLWNTNDKITLIGNGLAATVGTYTGADKAKNAEFAFENLTLPADGAWAVYGGTPTKLDAQYIYVTRPGTISMGSVQQAGLMAAHVTGENAMFYHADGYVGLKIKGEGSVKSIRLTTDNNAFLSGALRINITDGTVKGSLSADSGNRCGSIVLDCGEGVALGAEAREFILPVPPGSYNGLLATITLTDGSVMSKQTKSAKTIQRARVHWFPEITFAQNTVLLTSCEKWADSWQTAWKSTVNDAGNVKEGASCIYLKHNASAADGSVMYQTGVATGPTVLGEGIDSKATVANGKLVFYFWCNPKISGGTTVELSSNHANDHNERQWDNINVEGKLKSMTAGQWMRVELPISEAKTVGGDCDLSSIKRIRIINSNYNGAAGEFACRLDDIRIIEGEY